MNLTSLGERLREARKSLGQNQDGIASSCGVSREMWGKYERGLAMPGGEVLAMLAALGGDVNYILTGSRDRPAPQVLTEDEKGLLADYREASGPVRRAARAALQSGASPPGGTRNQTINAPVKGVVAGGNVTLGSHSINNNKNKK